MRKFMSKEVTFTQFKVSKIDVVEGIPTLINLPDEKILGTLSQEKTQKKMNKKHNAQVTIYQFETVTELYRMEVEKFIQLAEKVTEEEAEEIEEEESDEEE